MENVLFFLVELILSDIVKLCNPYISNYYLLDVVNSLKFYYRKSFITGFFGESLPFDSGLTSVIKGHGHQGPGDIEFQMYSTGEKAILMIRNPYHAIYGYRHYTFHGQLGHADASHFIGKGK